MKVEMRNMLWRTNEILFINHVWLIWHCNRYDAHTNEVLSKTSKISFQMKVFNSTTECLLLYKSSITRISSNYEAFS